nr:FAD-binding protein [Candidatus Sigynarchaeota archaeon]
MPANKDEITSIIARTCGSKNVSDNPSVLIEYARDTSFAEGKSPVMIAWPKSAKEVQQIIAAAQEYGIHLLPVSSSPGARVHGDSVPRSIDCVVVDLSRMRRIERLDRAHRVVALEPGVTFDDLLPRLREQGLRLNMPLAPRTGKSVVASVLEREPVAMPRYQWDSSDPLLCTEIVFGTGDMFRTGSAAGPGTIKEQRKSGQ